ncbi:MAG: hypothetical protein JNL64_12710 [Blastocatellia bacterium]|nr:hypothetical protein [Blastocatellia bacterium]
MNNVAMDQHERGVAFQTTLLKYIKKRLARRGKVLETGYRLLGLLISQNDLGKRVSSDLFPENFAKYATAKLVLIFDQNVLF